MKRSRRTVRPRQDLCASDLTRTEVSQYSHSDDIRETDRQQQQQFVSIKPFLPIWKSLVSIHSFIINSFYSSQALCIVLQDCRHKTQYQKPLQNLKYWINSESIGYIGKQNVHRTNNNIINLISISISTSMIGNEHLEL